MEAGSVVAVGAPRDVISHPRVVASYLGTEQPAVTAPGAAARGLLDRKE
jgi:hypothetical protein